MTLRAAVYCRISDDREGRAIGVATQEADCRAIAERNGWDISDVFVDNHRSAWKRDRKRPGWDRMMVGLGEKLYDVVIVWHGDRLMRQPRDLEDLLDIADRGVQVVSPGGQRDLADPDDRFILRIEVAHACRSSDDTSRRVKRAHLRLAEAGMEAGGGCRPFGFHPDRLTIDLHEAALIREAADRLLAGESIRGVAADWNLRGVSSVSGRPWTTSVLRRMVTSGRVCGWREHHGVLVAEALWPAILDRATVERLRGLLRDPARRVNGNPTRYLVSGLARCGLCDGRLVARPRDDKRRCYVCASGPNFHGCGKIRVLADPFEEWVAKVVLAALDSPDFTDTLSREAPSLSEQELVVEIGTVEAKLADLAAQWANDEITRIEWQAARKASEARLAEARRRLLEIGSAAPRLALAKASASLTATWDEQSFDRKRAVIVALVDCVTVGPAIRGLNRFDPRRVSIRWRA